MKKLVSIMLCVAMILSFAACAKKEDTTPTENNSTTVAEEEEVILPDGQIIANPLTGEDGYDQAMLGKRPVSIVVENSPAARPQWGITTPDIIVEGEVEGGITRMLWLYANYKSVPSKVGPIRSARPSYVKFSTFFDSVFIHWGGSNNHPTANGTYTGGYETISSLGVNDLDGMNGGELFAKLNEKKGGTEHNGIVKGENIASAIESKKYRTDINGTKATTFSFYDEATSVGSNVANNVTVKFSSRSDNRNFTYDSASGKYTTNDWATKVSFKNLIIMMDKTNYIKTTDGKKTTYLNYTLNSGSGYLISNGTMTEIKWDASSGKIKFTNADGSEIKLNVGDSYIGLASSNNGGSVNCK